MPRVSAKKPSRDAIIGKPAALLRRVIDRIAEEPARIDMDVWGRRADDHEYISRVDFKRAPACNTVGCIAGWVALDGVSAAKIRRMDKWSLARVMQSAEFDAADRLKITGLQRMRLFYEDSWPAIYRRGLGKAETPRAYGRAVINRIKHFIKTGK